MNKHGQPSTKAELIAAHGIEWYEKFLERNRKNAKARYDANPEAERQRAREKRAKYPETGREYHRRHKEIYSINMRDRYRLMRIVGDELIGKEIHHLKYHRDGSDESWRDDILILTPQEHRKWHRGNPDFRAIENVV